VSTPTATTVTYPDALREQIDAYLATLRFPSVAPQTSGLEEAMRYSLLAGGKRIRPVLALATQRAIGGDPAAVLPLAAAIELIHTYSLIHDDLPAMDDDDLRRGRPTCHVKFGEDVAILAGDALYAEAFRLLLTDQAGEPAGVLAAARELAAATGVDGMVGGQYLDVGGVAPNDAAGLRTVHALKTGRLIGASVECVLLLDGMGKPQGSDERHGKRTYVSEYGLDGARRLAGECHGRAHAALAQTGQDGTGHLTELEQITDFIFTRTS
jgi:geranylgeranyl diphosphate synthase type II